jgi:hypothetical protein
MIDGVEAAVERDLAGSVRGSALAATALALARELDRSGNSATSKSMCARALLDCLDRLRALAAEEPVADRLDDLAARRSARKAG